MSAEARGRNSGTRRLAVAVGSRLTESDDRDAQRLAWHMQRLRRARGLTQEAFAERCGLSPDTIRRIERGVFAPTLPTLRKVAVGLDLSLVTIFEALEGGEVEGWRETLDLLSTRTPSERVLGLAMLRSFFDALDRMRDEGRGDRDESPVSDAVENRERHAGVRQCKSRDGTG